MCENDKNFGDITLRLSDGNIKINSTFSLLKFENMRDLIKDEKFANEIPFDMISIKGYCVAEKYKSGYPVQISDDNIIDFLFCGIHLHEKDIIKECKNYMKNNENEKIVSEFMNNVYCVSRHLLNDFEFFANDYIFKQSYWIIYDSINSIIIFRFFLRFMYKCCDFHIE